MNNYGGGRYVSCLCLAVHEVGGLTRQTKLRQRRSPMPWQRTWTTHPLDFHDHDGDGFERAVDVVTESAEDASMGVDVCLEP